MFRTMRGRLAQVIIFSLVIILFVVGMAVRNNAAVVQSTTEQAMQQVLKAKQSAIDAYMSYIRSVAMNVAYNKAVQDLLSQIGEDRMLTSNLHSIVGSTINNVPMICDSVVFIDLLDSNNRHVADAGTYNMISYADFPIRREAYFGEVSMGVYFRERIPIFYFYLPIYSSQIPGFGERIGTLLCFFNTLELRDLLTSDDAQNQHYIVTSEDNRFMIGDNIRHQESWECPKYELGEIVEFQNIPQYTMVKTAQLEQVNWKLSVVNLEYPVKAAWDEIVIYNIWLFSGCVVTLMILYALFANSLRKHTKKIITLLEALPERKQIAYRLSLQEFIKIEETINAMMNKIEAMEEERERRIKETYDLSLAASRWEIDAIRRQLQPHFIYNTLEHLRGMALFHGADELSDQILRLAKILRYDFQGGICALVSQEIEMLDSYRTIITQRAGYRFEITISCQDELANASIPRMMLQPLVENAVQHGLQDVLSGGWVLVELKEESRRRMSITVSDNGAGMSQERLQQLVHIIQDHDDSVTDRGVGLISTIRRIRLMYQDRASWTLTSSAGKGTTVHIVIPIEEADHRAGSHCR